jgi:hypothetical protein
MRLNNSLVELGPAAWELARRLDGPEADRDAGTQVSRIDQGLQIIQRQLVDYHQRVQEVRQRKDELKSRTLTGIRSVAVLLSGICLWIAVSQVSILFHAWSWWKGRGANNC